MPGGTRELLRREFAPGLVGAAEGGNGLLRVGGESEKERASAAIGAPPPRPCPGG